MSRRDRALSALLLLVTAGLTNCGDMVDADTEGGGRGAVNMSLSIPNGSGTTESVYWQVFSADGITVVTGNVTIEETAAPPPVRFLLPAGDGQSVRLIVATSAGIVCRGTSAPFDVRTGQTAAIDVPLSCVDLGPDDASLTVEAAPVAGDHCPVLTSWTASSLQAPPGGTIDVFVTTSDTDPGDVLSYQWSATAGTFDGATSASVKYRCTTSGLEVLTVSVSDGHAPSPCAVGITLPPVTCP